MAMIIDANDEITVLAWAVVEDENESSGRFY
jgi:hypothetical protein